MTPILIPEQSFVDKGNLMVPLAVQPDTVSGKLRLEVESWSCGECGRCDPILLLDGRGQCPFCEEIYHTPLHPYRPGMKLVLAEPWFLTASKGGVSMPNHKEPCLQRRHNGVIPPIIGGSYAVNEMPLDIQGAQSWTVGKQGVLGIEQVKYVLSLSGQAHLPCKKWFNRIDIEEG